MNNLPEREDKPRIEKIRHDIRDFGWHVIKVPEDNAGPGFAYTIGLLTSYQHPEFIIFGLPIDTMHKILNNLGTLIKSGQKVHPDTPLLGVVKQDVPVKVKKVDWNKGRIFRATQRLLPRRSDRLPSPLAGQV